MKEKPSVDVIIPNYNKSDYIEEAINSVINQTYKNWFLYIIDDNFEEKVKQSRYGYELWRLILFILAILLALETYLSNLYKPSTKK